MVAARYAVAGGWTVLGEVGVTVAASASNGREQFARGYGGRTVWVTVCGQVEAEARIVAA
jgi:hypothetical protein